MPLMPEPLPAASPGEPPAPPVKAVRMRLATLLTMVSLRNVAVPLLT